MAGLLGFALLSHPSRAAPVDLSTVSCATYETQILASTLPGFQADPIDTVMWLFGFSVAKTGERVMFGDSLTAFGFALDGECKTNPDETLLNAIKSVKSKRDNPMDLTALGCTAFEARHSKLRKTDAESANTMTMWLYGYAAGLAGSQQMDPDALVKFDDGLAQRCETHPTDSLYDALNAPNPAIPAAPKPPAGPSKRVRAKVRGAD